MDSVSYPTVSTVKADDGSYLQNPAGVVVKPTPVRLGWRYPVGHRHPIFIPERYGQQEGTFRAFNFEKSLKTIARSTDHCDIHRALNARTAASVLPI